MYSVQKERDYKFQRDAKTYLYQRDKGVCAVCGIDTSALRTEYVEWQAESGRKIGWPKKKVLNLTYRQMKRETWWDADHKTPVHSDQKLACDLTNMQTLCIPCHQKKTKRERTPKQKLAWFRLKAARRGYIWKRTRYQ